MNKVCLANPALLNADEEGGAGSAANPSPRHAFDVVTTSAASTDTQCPRAGAKLEVGTGNGAASKAHEPHRASAGDGSFNKTVATPAPLNCQITAMPGAIRVTFHQPAAPDQAIKGTLVAQVHARGRLHHYRVAAADGVMHFVPRHWLSPLSRVLITHADRLAGRPLPDVGEQLDDLIAMMDEEKAIGTRAAIERGATGVPVLCLERVA